MRSRSRRAWAKLACAAIVLAPAITARGEERTGEQIFRQQCAACHGADGQGTAENYPEPLVGDKSVLELTDLIARTMPDGSPEECAGEDAAKVAAWMHDAFYSPVAQARLRPARLELSRLTVREYRNSVADLVGSFRQAASGDPHGTDQRGLSAEYYKSRRFRGDDRVFDRVDPVVRFDFEKSSPDPEKIDAKEFAIRWEGAVLAPDTGRYDLIIETKNGVRLWVNDNSTALIDGWVRSGDEIEHNESIFLLGGRVYPVRLEFFKSERDDAAAVTLKWKPPHQAVEVIPGRNLAPVRVPEVLVVETNFPPDDGSLGYVRGTAVSQAWTRATTMAAIEVAGKVAASLRELTGGEAAGRGEGRGGRGRFGRGSGERESGNAPNRDERLREFCLKFAERAFRRPLSEDELKVYVERQFAEAPDAESAVRRVVLLVLKSPRFLYREVGLGDFDAYSVASWMSYGLWDSLPDAELLEAAAQNELSTREQISRHAARMVADPRTKAKVREFLHQWLHLDRFHDLSKDAEAFPGFDEALLSDLRTSLDLFLEEAIWGETPDFRKLLLAEEVYLNGRLARFYGVDLPADGTDAGFQKVALEPGRRAGVLTHPYVLTGFAYHSTSSPIHRGVFVSRSVLGRFLKPPPEAFTPLAPELHPDLTTRERVELQTKPQSCQSCHALINPLGFALEHFDAVGRLRKEERNKPIDACGTYLTRTGERVEFNGPRELATYLAASDETHEAFVEQLSHSLLRQPVRALGPDHLAELKQAFVRDEFDVRKLLVEMVTASALSVDAALAAAR